MTARTENERLYACGFGGSPAWCEHVRLDHRRISTVLELAASAFLFDSGILVLECCKSTKDLGACFSHFVSACIGQKSACHNLGKLALRAGMPSAQQDQLELIRV